ncbi:FMN-dependent NADH-azoreductase [Pedobacter sp. L105]|uniref:FMN-dependent NADH-azoreductase n=1 Tax=Pedobacter sp. L105 TaxID=1641871 RepID=UPI00131C5E31|nr:NAD(P)H-dependent oxidoreductase [Pedobacter sp. L105]
MKKILHIISSPRGDSSFSIKLGNAIVDKIIAAYPGSTVTESNLVKKQFPHLEEAHLTSFFTPEDSRTPQDLEAIKHSDAAIKEIKDADIIVIDAPLYNFGIPSTLKAWIDHISRKGETFTYDENGPRGLINGKKLYIAVASGGVYSEGPMQPYDFVVPFLKAYFGFIGISDISVFRVEGTAVPGIMETALEKGIDSIVL